MAKRGNGEGSIYFDNSKKCWVAAISIGGRRVTRLASKKSDARVALTELQKQTHLGRSGSGSPRSVGSLLDQWLENFVNVQDLAPATKASKKWAVERLTAKIGSVQLRRLSFDEIESALRAMSGSPDNLSKASLTKIRVAMNQACKWGVRRGYLPDNPVAVVDLPKTKLGKPKRSLSLDELERFQDAMTSDPLEAFWMVLVGCGLRLGEARALQWSDFDPENGRLAVRRNARTEEGKTNTSLEMKTEASRRTLDLPRAVNNALQRHMTRQIEADQYVKDGLIFTTCRGTIIDSSNLRKRLARICDSAEIARICPHELRHTCASVLAHEGIPAEKIADVLGHKSVRTTIDTYRHILGPSADGLVQPMNAILEG